MTSDNVGRGSKRLDGVSFWPPAVVSRPRHELPWQHSVRPTGIRFTRMSVGTGRGRGRGGFDASVLRACLGESTHPATRGATRTIPFVSARRNEALPAQRAFNIAAHSNAEAARHCALWTSRPRRGGTGASSPTRARRTCSSIERGPVPCSIACSHGCGASGEVGKGRRVRSLEAVPDRRFSERGYRDLGRELGMSEGAVKVTVHRLRRRYRDLLREEIAETVLSDDGVDEEIRHLFRAARRHADRLVVQSAAAACNLFALELLDRGRSPGP